MKIYQQNFIDYATVHPLPLPSSMLSSELTTTPPVSIHAVNLNTWGGGMYLRYSLVVVRQFRILLQAAYSVHETHHVGHVTVQLTRDLGAHARKMCCDVEAAIFKNKALFS